MSELMREQFIAELETYLGMPMAQEYDCGDGPTDKEVEAQRNIIVNHDAALRARVAELEREKHDYLTSLTSELIFRKQAEQQLATVTAERDNFRQLWLGDEYC